LGFSFLLSWVNFVCYFWFLIFINFLVNIKSFLILNNFYSLFSIYYVYFLLILLLVFWWSTRFMNNTWNLLKLINYWNWDLLGLCMELANFRSSKKLNQYINKKRNLKCYRCYPTKYLYSCNRKILKKHQSWNKEYPYKKQDFRYYCHYIISLC